ncbi:hypothetical protein EOT00_06730 [Listeria seeligeri]|uniref:hypothetical protein n=1 Tax=Listeria seeligeri TaxID=1640 RepID=UPI001119CC2E|nr:hypothetical protein [Listeria seeligeri]QDA74652.1 hypothetical protein EOT00_06730 [Listeria seeligeri]
MKHFEYDLEEYKKILTDEYLVSLLLDQGYEVEEKALSTYFKKMMDLNADLLLDNKTYYKNEGRISKFKANKSMYSSNIKSEKVISYTKISEAA